MVTTTTAAIAAAVAIALVTYGLPLLLAEYFPWRSLWKQKYGRPEVTTRSYRGRTALVTGANGAYGSRAAKLFGRHEVDTLVLVDVMDCTWVKEEIEAEIRRDGKKRKVPKILVWKVDMMTLAGCVEIQRRVRSELPGGIDHALLTAGILSFNRRESPDGWETCMFFFSFYFSSFFLGGGGSSFLSPPLAS